MISWGLEVNDYGNAILDKDGNFIKIANEGASEEVWSEMTEYAAANGLKGGNYKKLNRPFESKLLSQPEEIRERMSNRVEAFVYDMMINVFNSKDTASIVYDAIIEANSYDPGPKASRIENPDEWTNEKIIAKAENIKSDKGPSGDFDD
jgi:fructose-bisphosphate aldolase class II